MNKTENKVSYSPRLFLNITLESELLSTVPIITVSTPFDNKHGRLELLHRKQHIGQESLIHQVRLAETMYAVCSNNLTAQTIAKLHNPLIGAIETGIFRNVSSLRIEHVIFKPGLVTVVSNNSIW